MQTHAVCSTFSAMYVVPPAALPARRLLARAGELDLVVLALLGWAAVEPWGLGVPDPVAEAVPAVVVAAPLLARRAAPGAAAAATLAAVLVQWALGAGGPPLHASIGAALVAGYVLGGIAVASLRPAVAVAGGFLASAQLLADLDVGGWAEAGTQSQLTFAGVLLGGFAIGFFPGHRAARAAALRSEVSALERELAAELRSAAAAERAVIAEQLEQLLARVTRRTVPSVAADGDRGEVALALQRTERAARAASRELRGLLDVLDAPARPAPPPPEPLITRIVRFHARFGPVLAFAAIGVVEQLLLPARPAEVAPGVLVEAPPYSPAIAVAMAIATALPLVLRDRAPLVAIAAVGSLLVGRSAVRDLSSLTWSQNALGVGLAFAAGAFAAGTRRSLAGLALAAAATAAAWTLEQTTVTAFEWAYLAVLLVAAWFAGREMRPHVAAASRGDDELSVLRTRRSGLAQQAAVLERQRVAREVHDLVGHGLSLMSMHAAVGAARLERGVESVDEAVRRIRMLAAGTERELDLLLTSLRAPREDGDTGAPVDLGDLHELVAGARRHGQPVTVEGADLQLPSPAARVVVDVVREGLTNARKHAGTAPVRVAVSADDDLVRLEVVNEPGAPLLGAGSRRGLAWLSERVEAAGGFLAAGPSDDGGWRLSCALPRRAAVADGLSR